MARCRARKSAHPRVGGENARQIGYVIGVVGSSPRGRGKPPGQCRPHGRVRLIPAWAGKTVIVSPCADSVSAHPRVGGENAQVGMEPPGGAGSSPRGRGKHSRRHPKPRRGRLIPAWAGKTTAHNLRTPGVPAHPRVGGENVLDGCRFDADCGSSPRGRGKRHADALCRPRAGLIPAWAGKTSKSSASGSAPQAHPRVGGENHGLWDAALTQRGSSPRGRGKLEREPGSPEGRGLIPAWAGKTSPPRTLRAAPWAHPRVGGENRLFRVECGWRRLGLLR